MRRILLVDDDPRQLHLFSLLARRLGMEADACDQFDAQDRDWAGYDLVVCDAMMPVLSGPDLVRQAQARLGERLPPVLLLSAMSVGQLRQISRGLPVRCLSKVGSPREIMQRVQASAEV